MTPEQEIAELQQQVQDLQYKLNQVIYPDRYQFDRTIFHKGNKLGFFSTTPIIQLGAITAPTGGATVDSQSRTAINTIIADIKAYGFTL